MATKTEDYIKKLKRMGFEEIETRSNKKRAFHHSELKNLIFVSRNAAIRYGRSVTNSIAIHRPDELLNHLQQKFIEEVVK